MSAITASNCVLLLRVDPVTSRRVHRASDADGGFVVRHVSMPDDALAEMRDGLPGVDAVVVGTLVDDPIQTCQRIHRMDADVPVILLSEAARFAALSRAIQFAPFLGNEVRCLSLAAVHELPEHICAAVELVKQRRHHQEVISAAASAGAPEPVSIQRHQQSRYLDKILVHAPIGIVTVDSEARIIAWNPYAAEMLDLSEGALLGTDFASLFSEANQQAVGELMRGAAQDVGSNQVHRGMFCRHQDTHAERYLEVTVTSFDVDVESDVEGEGFLVLLQDVSRTMQDERALRRAVRARDEFIGICSHELKTPVTSMMLQLQMLARRLQRDTDVPLGRESVLHRTNIAIKQLDRMTKLIESMLDISRVDSCGLTLAREPVDLHALCCEVAECFADQLAAVTVSLGPRTRPGATIVQGDRYRLEQVVSNLLANGIKYGAGSPVSLRVTAGADGVRLTVTDRGLGVATEDVERIFERFERAVPHVKISGLGLGLYICRQIVEAHGGKIWAQSALGEGTTFIVELPGATPFTINGNRVH